MSCLLETAKSDKLLRIGPADQPAPISWQSSHNADPTSLDPGEQCILGHVQLGCQVVRRPLVLPEILAYPFGLGDGTSVFVLIDDPADDIAVELDCLLDGPKPISIELLCDFRERQALCSQLIDPSDQLIVVGRLVVSRYWSDHFVLADEPTGPMQTHVNNVR
jgi:hypothetical protein